MALRRDLDRLLVDLLLQETEDTWDRIARSIKTLIDLCQNGACDSPEELVPAMKGISRPLINALNSERTRLSGPAIDLFTAMATGLGSDFDPLLSIFFQPLLSLCARTNKVVATRATACILTIIRSTQLPSILPHLLQYSKDKAPSLRLVVAEGTLACLNCFNPPDLEKEARAKDIESLIRITANDSAADVRRISRAIFEAYRLLLPARVASFIAPLSPTTKKYLDIKPNHSGFDGRVTFHRPNSSLAASTSSARSSQSISVTAQERPKSSSSNRKADLFKPAKPNPEPQVLASSKPVIVRVPSEAHRTAARRVPVTGCLSNNSQSRSTRATADGAKARPNETQMSDGPRRMALPETVSIQETKQEPRTRKSNSKVAAPLRPPLTKKLVGSGIIRTKTQARIKNLPRSQSTAQMSGIGPGKTSRTTSRIRNVSQPTQSQLAKVRGVAKRKPTDNRIGRKRSLPIKQGGGSSVELRPSPPSRSPTPTSVVQPESDAEQPKDQDSGGETPRKPSKNDMTNHSLINKTPITALLSSIEQGFLLSPFSPLSPPQSYLDQETFDTGHFPLRLQKKDGLKTEPNEGNMNK